MALRIVIWNMNHSFRRGQPEEQWAFLDSLEPTIALVQETPPRAGNRNAILHEVQGRQGLYTGIVAYKGVTLNEIPTVPLGQDPGPGALEASHPGSFVVARADLGSGLVVTVVSIYGVMKAVLTNVEYATTTVQRTLSDLTPILDVNPSQEAVVLGGDINVTPQIRPVRYRAAHVAIIDRIKAFGMTDCLGKFNEGYVRTLRHQNRPDSTPYQNDWIFASKKLVPLSCRAIDTEAAWALSDHCPVLAEFEVTR